MEIKINQRVEDSHKYIDEDGNVQYDVRKFGEGEIIDQTDLVPNWERRAKKLVDYGFAEYVTQD